MTNTTVAQPVPTTLWRHPDFLKLWAAQTISVFGSQFSGLAVPLIAVLTLDATPGQMGLLSAAHSGPFLILALFAGVWVDRLRRRPVLIVSDLGRGLVLCVVTLAAIAGVLRMSHLYLAAATIGVLTVFFDVAYQAYLPALVARRQLVEGNSKLEVSRSMAQISGPGIAGFVVELLSAAAALAIDALSFFISALFLGLVRKLEARPETVRPAMLSQIREGLGFVLGNVWLRAIAGCTATFNLFTSALFALFVLFASRELAVTPAQLGIIFAFGSSSGLLGALLASSLARRFGVGAVIVASPLLSGLGLLLLPLATPHSAFPLLAASQFLLIFGIPVYNINQVSLRQAITSDHLQGRMHATMRFLVWGTMPLGGLAGGVLGEALGLRAAIAIAAIGVALSFLWVYLSPVRQLKEIPDAEQTSITGRSEDD